MAENDDIPPIPPAPGGTSVPPVEPPPAAPAPPAAPVPPPASPGAPDPLTPVSAPADPYAQPQAYAATPAYAPPAQQYAQPGAVPTYPAQGYAYAPAVAGPPQGLSLAAMIVGIAAVLLSFVSLGLLPSIAAVILGHLGQRRQPHARTFWLTGLITGYVGLGISLIWVLYYIIIVVVAGIAASTGSY